MKLSMSATIAALVLAIPATSASAAAPIRECGNYGWPEGYEGSEPIWTYEQLDGAGIFNVTTRRVACRKARRFVLRYRGTDTYFPTWNCREINRYEFSDVRCTARRGRVIRWQTGA